jgi:hypothetical protein
MARGKIQVMIQELSAPVEMKVRKTREEFLNLLEAVTYHDPGKMFDSHGNPLEIQDMPFAERMAVAGFEFVEDFTDVKKPMGKRTRWRLGSRRSSRSWTGTSTPRPTAR